MGKYGAAVVAGGRRLAFVFPGQASQRAGMAADLLACEPAAREVFRRADDLLGLDLTAICTTGDEATLTRTEIAQPALLATSLAWLRVLTERGGLTPHIVAGHSLGEFAAWVAAGALTLEAALQLVQRRGKLMEEAGRSKPGGMLAVLGLPDDQVEALCAPRPGAGVLVVANYNSPGQVVVSGELSALNEVKESVKEAKGTAIPLRVSGAFHSPLMEDVAREFAALVAHVELADPRVPVVANATAEPVTAADQVRCVITRQMTSPVYWTTSVQRMAAEGVETFLEVGPGQVLTKLIKRITPAARSLAVSAADLSRVIEEISA